jgi:hypothetical protein
MDMTVPLARLSPDQLNALKDYEHALAEQFGNPVTLLAFDSKK